MVLDRFWQSEVGGNKSGSCLLEDVALETLNLRVLPPQTELE